MKRGGVGLYVKDTFPAKDGPDLETLPECIVCEFQLDRKKYFFVVLYRSPSQSQNEFQVFMNNFELMLSKMSDENPYCVIVTALPIGGRMILTTKKANCSSRFHQI